MSEKSDDLHKAALVLMAIKSDVAAKILKAMTKEERFKLSQAMTSLGAVSGDFFNSTMKQAVDFLRNSSSYVGNQVSTREFLNSVLNEEEANEIIANIEWSIWEKISRVDHEILATYLAKQHAQVVAVILSLMHPEATSKVLGKLPEDIAERVMLRLSDMHEVDRELVAVIESTLQKDWDEISGQSDGSKLVINLFENFDRGSEEKFIKVIEKHDKSLANAIKKGMFSFEDIAKLGDSAMQSLLREVNKEKLIVAMKGASSEISSLIYKNMSERASRILKGDIESQGPVRLTEVEEAQSHIAKVAKRLIKEGIILFGDETC